MAKKKKKKGMGIFRAGADCCNCVEVSRLRMWPSGSS